MLSKSLRGAECAATASVKRAQFANSNMLFTMEKAIPDAVVQCPCACPWTSELLMTLQKHMPTGQPDSALSFICTVASTLTMAVRYYDGARYSHVHVFDSNYDDDDATAHAEGLNSAAYGQSHFVARLMQTAKNYDGNDTCQCSRSTTWPNMKQCATVRVNSVSSAHEMIMSKRHRRRP